jgi:Zn-dependent membrane protease YugP
MNKITFVVLVVLKLSLVAQADRLECKSTYEQVTSTSSDVSIVFIDKTYRTNSIQEACLKAKSRNYIIEDENGAQMLTLRGMVCQNLETRQEVELNICK